MIDMFARARTVTLDLLFPPQCALCSRGGTLLCDRCAQALPRARGRRCERCWMPARRSLCAHCEDAPPAFWSLRAAYVMDGGARRLAHELKYEGLTSLAAPMAALIADDVEPLGIDVVVPVPLHPSRERARGYNQAAELARGVASGLGLKYDGRAARRVRNTEPLVKAMSRDERRRIVAGAFEACAGRVDNRRVMLIDDVCTTGATLDDCARALLEAGAISVRCVVWARAD